MPMIDQLTRLQTDVATLLTRTEALPGLQDRVTTLERWRWALTGALIALAGANIPALGDVATAVTTTMGH